MAIPTLEQKLKWLKPEPPTEQELACVADIELGDYEIGFQRTNDILDEGMEVFVRSCRSAMGIAGDFAGRHHDGERRHGERLVRHLPSRRHSAAYHQVHHAHLCRESRH